MKSWTELLWDWPAIERTDRKLNNSGLENPVLVGGDEKEAGETCVKRERVGFELDEIGFAKSKDADMGPKTRSSFLMRKRMVEQSIGPSFIEIHSSAESPSQLLGLYRFVNLPVTRGGLCTYKRVKLAPSVGVSELG